MTSMASVRTAATKGKWSEVLKMYKGERELRTAEITSTGDTILHMAVSRGHVGIVKEMVDFVCNKQDNDLSALSPSSVDDNGDEKLLVLGAENKKVHLQEMNKRNKNGLSPLHILAASPLAFASTDVADRPFVVRLLYHWFFRVKEKTQATRREELEQRERKPHVDAFMDELEEFGSSILCESVAEEVAEGLPCCIASIWMLIVFPLRLLAWVLLILLIVFKILLRVSAAGIWFYVILFHGIRNMKEEHTWSLQIVEKLLKSGSSKHLFIKPYEKETDAGSIIVDTPLMIAAKNGAVEMVENILKEFPTMMKVANEEGKNIFLLAAENRQTKLYQFLCENENVDKSIFSQVDKDGNTAFHLAAKPGLNLDWQATTMVEEFKWFEFVRCSVPCELREKYNNAGKTAKEIFRDSYKEHITSDRQWLNQTSQTCSLASTLVASMAFSNIVSDKFDEKNYSTLAALSLALTSTISLAILAFRSQSLNFWRYAPIMLHIAILTMLGSIVVLWIALVLNAKSFKTCAILGTPIAILTVVSLPIFIGPTLKSLFTKVPAPNRNTTSVIQYRRPQIKENATDVNRNQKPTPNMESRAHNSLQNI